MMAIVCVYDEWSYTDKKYFWQLLHDAEWIYRMYLIDKKIPFNKQYRYFFRQKKGTESVIVKIKGYPEPEALISAMAYYNVFDDYDPIFLVDGKKAKLDSNGEVVDWEEYLNQKRAKILKSKDVK